MHYSIEKLQNERWGIYYDFKLLATIGCHQTALVLLTRLQKPRPERLYKKAVQTTVEKRINRAA